MIESNFMYKKLIFLFLSVFLLFAIMGCYSYRPEVIIYPIYITSSEEKSIRIEEEKKDFYFSPWEKLDKDKDVDEALMKVYANKNLSKLTLEIGHPTALSDFNDSYVDIDPNLIHVSINGQKIESVNKNGKFLFNYEFKNTGESVDKYNLDINYDNLFRTRRNISIFWNK